MDVDPRHAGVEAGLTVALVTRVTRMYVTGASRVVTVTDENARFGFAYGTLPDHLIKGEESFFVERDDQDAVTFVITAFTRPRPRVLATVGPVVHALDQRIVRRYLRGLQDFVAQHA